MASIALMRNRVRGLRLLTSQKYFQRTALFSANNDKKTGLTLLCNRKDVIERPTGFRCAHYSVLHAHKTHHRVNNSLQNREPNAALQNSGLTNTSHLISGLTHQVRCYAKKTKDKKGKKGGGKQALKLTDEEMTQVVDLQEMGEEMKGALAQLQNNLVQKLSLRTNIETFETLRVETSDGTFPLIQIGQVIQKSPSLVIINMDAAPHYSKDVKIALQKSSLNLNPQQDGSSFFVPLPKITREHREGLAKSAKSMNEKTKAQLKSIQNRYIRDLNSDKEVSDDLKRNIQDHIHNATKTFNAEADAMVQAKQKDLLG